MRETDISEDAAAIVAREVEKLIGELQLDVITAPLIRELTNAKLVEYGLAKIRRQHTRLGVPLYDARQIIMSPNKENANVPHGPEATNLTLAEQIKKEFALLEVFSQDLADAHMRGDIHLHDLGMIDRPYCGGQSIEYVKKFGLNLPNAISIAKPAKHPEVLIEQVVKFSAALQGNFAGAIGWDAFNLFLAPYLVGVDDTRMKQLAQILIFEFAQQAVARGGQSIFSDLNLYWEVPDHFQNVEAIGPNGLFTGKVYGDYAEESQRFVNALFDVYLEGDAMGRPFFFPKPNVHMTEKFFKTEGHEEFLNKICTTATEKGNTYFVFDRGGTAKISECCRLTFKLDDNDLNDAKTPWKMRYSAMQNVTINLPRIAYEAHQDDEKLFKLLEERIELVAQAHLQKREFIGKLLAMGKYGPLALLTMNLDGEQYYRFNKASFLIGMVGLNELVQYHTGEQMHETKNATMFGLKVISVMKKYADAVGQKYGIKMPLEQTPAESTAYRFAKLDMKYYPLQAPTVIRGNKSIGEIYYTNSTYLNVGAQISAIERVKAEGLFHPLVEAGALTHVWLGEHKPSAESLAAFVVKTFKNTENSQIAFSPEFTSCLSCGKTGRGLKDTCSYCHSPNVEGITRVTGFFSKTSGWNKGKLGELKERTHNNIS
ncbi:MAG: anaerobic ribonucleoside-triphosphate reductase [Methanomassiliicoccales archaeon]|nr:anaerobic ribonucleoside-triphosphate reductase [Methanomassiliicoccales archaeon]